MFCIGNFLLWIFALVGFVKACLVGLTDTYLYYTFSAWHRTQSFLHGAVPRSHRVLLYIVYLTVFVIGGAWGVCPWNESTVIQISQSHAVWMCVQLWGGAARHPACCPLLLLWRRATAHLPAVPGRQLSVVGLTTQWWGGNWRGRKGTTGWGGFHCQQRHLGQMWENAVFTLVHLGQMWENTVFTLVQLGWLWEDTVFTFVHLGQMWEDIVFTLVRHGTGVRQ